MQEKKTYGATGKIVYIPPKRQDGDGPDGWYKIVDRPGHSTDLKIHNGEIVSVKRRGRWIDLWANSDGEKWTFRTEAGTIVELGSGQIPARHRLS